MFNGLKWGGGEVPRSVDHFVNGGTANFEEDSGQGHPSKQNWDYKNNSNDKAFAFVVVLIKTFEIEV